MAIINKKRRKYNNTPTFVDGIKFDSKKESERYKEILLLKASGEIKEFVRQEPFKLGGRFRYVSDFYITWKDGTKTVKDVKSYKTQAYKVKKAWMKEKYGIEIVEI